MQGNKFIRLTAAFSLDLLFIFFLFYLLFLKNIFYFWVFLYIAIFFILYYLYFVLSLINFKCIYFILVSLVLWLRSKLSSGQNYVFYRGPAPLFWLNDSILGVIKKKLEKNKINFIFFLLSLWAFVLFFNFFFYYIYVECSNSSSCPTLILYTYFFINFFILVSTGKKKVIKLPSCKCYSF